MKVLVACEFSGIVRDAFTAAGHDATSCDLEPSETPGKHIQDNVLKHVEGDWDLIIAHPPCTHLASSGARWWPFKADKQAKAIGFFLAFTAVKCPRVAIENPVGIMSTAWRKSDQIIQPFQFGHPEWKTTCLWLKGLPKLVPTGCVEADKTVGGGKRPGRISSRIHRMGPSKRRERERSRTYPGIAAAMAAQWGNTSLQPGLLNEKPGQNLVFDRSKPDGCSLRYCVCADPENCTEAMQGYICKAGKSCSQSAAEGKP